MSVRAQITPPRSKHASHLGHHVILSFSGNTWFLLHCSHLLPFLPIFYPRLFIPIVISQLERRSCTHGFLERVGCSHEGFELRLQLALSQAYARFPREHFNPGNHHLAGARRGGHEGGGGGEGAADGSSVCVRLSKLIKVHIHDARQQQHVAITRQPVVAITTPLTTT